MRDMTALETQTNPGVAVMDDSLFGAVPNRGEILRTEGLRKTFHSGTQEITPLEGIDFSADAGEMIAIVGPSGAGKSTLLHLMAALDTPTSGEVYFAGKSLGSLGAEELAEYRNRAVGFVWQRHHLLPDFTVAENVAMPLVVRGTALGEALSAAGEWLKEVGLEGRAGQRAAELSGGEQQRVAMARALVSRPALLLADEPTGDLDERSAETIFELMQRLHRSYHLTSVIATHNISMARRADRVLVLEHGKLAPVAEIRGGEAARTARMAGAGALALGERG